MQRSMKITKNTSKSNFGMRTVIVLCVLVVSVLMHLITKGIDYEISRIFSK
jgi:hypothetical protein